MTSEQFAAALHGTTPQFKSLALGGGPEAEALRVKPGEQVSISRCPARAADALCIHRIVIPHGHHWVVNDILIGGQSQLRQKDIPGALFSTSGITTRGGTSLVFHDLDVVTASKDLTLVVTYVGPNADGEPFFATAVGISPPVVLPALHVTSSPIKESGTIVVRPEVTFKSEALRIGGTPTDWMLLDFRIGGKSQFTQGGAIPGDMFAINAIGEVWAAGRLDVCHADATIELDVAYIGENPDGGCFEARIEGMVVSIDQMSPELRSQIDTIAQTPLAGRAQQVADMEIL